MICYEPLRRATENERRRTLARRSGRLRRIRPGLGPRKRRPRRRRQTTVVLAIPRLIRRRRSRYSRSPDPRRGYRGPGHGSRWVRHCAGARTGRNRNPSTARPRTLEPTRGHATIASFRASEARVPGRTHGVADLMNLDADGASDHVAEVPTAPGVDAVESAGRASRPSTTVTTVPSTWL